MNRKQYRHRFLANEPEGLKLQRIRRRYRRLLLALIQALPAKKKSCVLVLAEMQKEWLRLNARQAYHEGAIFANKVYCEFIKQGAQADD